jgi:hypothetical protein
MSAGFADQAVAPEDAPTHRALPSLRSNFGWTFTGNALYAACQWGMLSVLAKAGSASIVGQFALGLAVSAPVFMFTNLQLRAVKATDARSEFEFADYFSLRVLASLAGLLAVAVVAWVLPFDLPTRLVVLLLGVSKAVESLSDVVAGLLQKHERLDQVAISLVVRGVLSIAAFGFVFLRSHSLVSAVVALAAAARSAGRQCATRHRDDFDLAEHQCPPLRAGQVSGPGRSWNLFRNGLYAGSCESDHQCSRPIGNRQVGAHVCRRRYSRIPEGHGKAGAAESCHLRRWATSRSALRAPASNHAVQS